MDWITENIALGDFIDAEKASSDELDAVLCLKPDCCDQKNEDLDVLCIPLIDGAGNNQADFNEAIEYIHDVVSDGEKILVHCHAGRSRSVCILARYFMVKCNMGRQQALNTISAKREIYLSPGIEEILQLGA